jgi:hypothetical protein
VYEELRTEHKQEEKLMGLVLSEKELHRLRKIYAVEEAEYMIRVLSANDL